MGTRPEIIKLAPVINALQKLPRVSASVILTGQHRELAEQALKVFRVPIDRDLELMRTGQSPAEVAAGILQGLGREWRVRSPSAVLVQGDTTSAMVAGLTAFYNRIPVGHVEAGLRTGDLEAPYPEELNRKVIATFARWNFAPTKRAMRNLLREGASPARVYVTGNTIVDALHFARRRIASISPSALASLRKEIAPQNIHLRRQLGGTLKRKLVVVTLHRRESFGAPLRSMLQVLRQISFLLARFIKVNRANLRTCPIRPLRQRKLIHVVRDISVRHCARSIRFVADPKDAGLMRSEASYLNEMNVRTREQDTRPPRLSSSRKVSVLRRE